MNSSIKHAFATAVACSAIFGGQAKADAFLILGQRHHIENLHDNYVRYILAMAPSQKQMRQGEVKSIPLKAGTSAGEIDFLIRKSLSE